MAGLERAGYLQQPHTSAGRIPTAKAFEFYARRMVSKAQLHAGVRNRIDRLLAGTTAAVEDLLARAPHALSEVCHGVGLLVLPPLSSAVLEQIRFMPLDGNRVLVAAVTRSGLVRDKVVRTRERFSLVELEKMTTYLNRHFRGWTLESIRKELERRVAAERSRFLQQALALCEEGFAATGEEEPLRLEGVAHLLEQTEAADPKGLRSLLQALEEKQRLARLVADCVEGPEAPLRILVGLEELSPAMQAFTFIGTSYGMHERPQGWLGLLGPTRMDYARAITAVRYVGALVDQTLAEN